MVEYLQLPSPANLSSSNWIWNFVLAVITPAMVDEDKGNLREKVFFVWGTLCAFCFVYAYMLVPETRGLTLEQVDRMLEECSPRTSAKWRPDTSNMYSVRKNRASVAEPDDEDEVKQEHADKKPSR